MAMAFEDHDTGDVIIYCVIIIWLSIISMIALGSHNDDLSCSRKHRNGKKLGVHQWQGWWLQWLYLTCVLLHIFLEEITHVISPTEGVVALDRAARKRKRKIWKRRDWSLVMPCFVASKTGFSSALNICF